MKTIIKTISTAFIAILPMISWGQTEWTAPATVGSRPELVLLYSYERTANTSTGTQDLKIICKNITTDKITFKISYEVHFHNGAINKSSNSFGIFLNPGETLDPTWLSTQANSYQRFLLDDYGPKEKWHKYAVKDKNDKQRYTAIYAVMNMKITDFENISQKERDEKAKQEKEKAEREKASKGKQEAEQKRLAEEKARKEKEVSKGEKSSASTQQNDFWGENSKGNKTETPTKNFVPSNVSVEQYRSYPEEFKTNDGKYIAKDNGHLVYISESEYNQRKADHQANLVQQGEQARAKLQEKQNQQAQATLDNIHRQQQESIARKERSDAYMQSASYYAQDASYAREARIDASGFQQNHTNLESLQADYNRKIQQLRQAGEQENIANQGAYANAAAGIAEAGFGSSEISQSAGQLGAMIGGMVSSSNENKARQELKRQRDEQTARIKAAKTQALMELRAGISKTFPDGGMPISSHKITAPILYVFAYNSNKAEWEKDQSVPMNVSNVIPVYRYKDGTYPYTANVKRTFEAAGLKEPILMGYFTDKNEAEKYRHSLLELAPDANLIIKDIEVKQNQANSKGEKNYTQQNDFWGSGSSGEPQAPNNKEKKSSTPTKETNFWGN